tara:strand:- start:279 stop:1985 length:1707 start_codon:yes stop_codon:yes gene_type:complete
MHALCALVLALFPLAASAQEKGPACRSGLRGDFGFKTCADFCNQARAPNHCRFCKCQQCSFCGATPASSEAQAAPVVAAAVPARAPPPIANYRRNSPPGMRERPRRPPPLAPPLNAPPLTGGKQHTGWSTPSVVGVLLVVVGAAVAVTFMVANQRAKQAELLNAPTEGTRDDSSEENLLPDEAGKPSEELRAKGGTPQTVARSSGQTFEQLRIRTLCVAFLCVQYSAYALLRRYATGVLKEGWSSASVLGVGEALKFVISLAMIARREDGSESPKGPVGQRLSWLLSNSAKMAVPAGIYLAMNMLGFVSLHRIDAGTFAVVQQSKIFFTALFGRLFLGRILSSPKWCALVTLVLGVLLITLEAQPNHQACADPTQTDASRSMMADSPVSYMIGVVAVTLDSLLSGFATVYFEKVLKTTVLTVWDRNLQLAFYSMLIYGPWTIYDNPTDPFRGWSMVTVIVAVLGAGGGILVALVIKYADGLAKSLSTASSIVLTTAASHFLFGGAMSSSIVIGSLVVIASGYNYQNGAALPPRRQLPWPPCDILHQPARRAALTTKLTHPRRPDCAVP